MIKVRKHIRLKNYDYSSAGLYYITVCTKNREFLFGEINQDTMNFSEIGRIAYNYWLHIPEHYERVILDEFVVMPNHIHGILMLNVGTRDCVRLRHGVIQQNKNQFGNPIPYSISMIINQYKSSVKRWCNKNGFEHFAWQPRFYDHIIRNERSLTNIRNYIISNPINWHNDKLYVP